MSFDEYQPSQRGRATLGRGRAWDAIMKVHRYPAFDPKVPAEGVINLMGAHNALMSDWMKDYVEKDAQSRSFFDDTSYGSPYGSSDLRRATAGFLNRHFKPARIIDASHIVATNGVTSAIDLLTWAICEPGDAVLYPTPNFYMLDFDLAARNDLVNIPVDVESTIDGDAFAPTLQAAEQLASTFDRAIRETQSLGLRCRVLFLCNPANPQGRCYSPLALQKLAELCTKHRMHLVCDEIYAFSNMSEGREPFSSVLTVPYHLTAEFQNVHCLYGMSKDFSLGGLRMGFIVTRNGYLRNILDRLCFYTWGTTTSDSFITRLLLQHEVMNDYITVYQRRLASAYISIRDALLEHRIPFLPATAGLFIFINLSYWLRYFPTCKTPPIESARYMQPYSSKELQLWQWLLDNGIALNPGEFAQHSKAGWLRMVFTENVTAAILAVARLRKALDSLENDVHHETSQ